MIAKSTHFFGIALVIVGLASVLRLAWAVLIPVVPIADGDAYNILAHNLLEHGFYGWAPDKLSAWWAPGTATVYAALYAVFGYTFTPIVALNITLSTATVGLTIWLGRMFFDDDVALVAGGLMAVWPTQIGFVTVLASEVPFTFFILLGIGVWFSSNLSPLTRAIVSGLMFGVATYFRPVALLLPIVLWLTSILSWRKLRAEFAVAFIAMIVVCATIAPWTMRNTKVFGHVVLLTSSSGVNFWEGNNPDATGFYMNLPADVEPLNEYEKNRILGERARRYVVENPVTFVWRTIVKAVRLHIGETMAVHWNAESIKKRFGEWALLPLKLLTQGSWLAALLLGLAGLIIMARERGGLAVLTHPLVLVWGYFTAVYAIVVISDRYHFPSHPLIAMLAAIAILVIIGKIRPISRGAET